MFTTVHPMAFAELRQSVVFIPLPWVNNSFLIYFSLINGPRYSYNDQFAAEMTHK
jgi:hypothetical protein